MLCRLLLARLDADIEAILPGRQRAGRERGERARRRVRLVEIEYDLAVLRRLGMEEPAGGVGVLSRRHVLEDEEQLLGVGLLEDRVEAELTAAKLERDVTRARHRLDHVEHVRDGDLLRRVVGREPRLDAVALAHRIPLEAAEE